jgi:hypothetical protein
VTVVDEDLGLSGSVTVKRSGFVRMTAEVALRHVGIVLGLEVSRLAHNNADWYRLLDLCGIPILAAQQLEDSVFANSQFNAHEPPVPPSAVNKGRGNPADSVHDVLGIPLFLDAGRVEVDRAEVSGNQKLVLLRFTHQSESLRRCIPCGATNALDPNCGPLGR